MRAHRRLTVCVLLAVVCLLASCKHAAQPSSFSLLDVMSADVAPSHRGEPVHSRAVVTYSDPEWHLLFVQDPSWAVYIQPTAGPSLKAGDEVQVTGFTTTPDRFLDGVKFSVLSNNGHMPPPVNLANASEFPNFPSRWIQTTGIVRWSGIRSGRATMTVFAGDRAFRALVFPGTSEDLPRAGAEIEIAGVAAAVYGKDGRVQTVQLLTPSARYIRVLKAGPADLFSVRLNKLWELRNVRPGSLVHVAGRVLDRSDGTILMDGGVSVPVSFLEMGHGDLAAAEVAGFWNGHNIEDALVRPAGRPVIQGGDVTRISVLKQMTADGASAHRRVNVRAVVTYWDPYWHILFVQEGNTAAFVLPHAPYPTLRAGDLVNVTGVSSPGDFAPLIADATVMFAGHGRLPDPLQLDLVNGNLSTADSQWCTFRGVVHTTRVRDGHTVLKLGAGQTALYVTLPALIRGDELLDKEVSVTGALAILFNERRQAVGHQIFAPAPEFLKIEGTGGTPNPPSTIASLRRYGPTFDERHAVQLDGKVVLKAADSTIFVQDQTAGVEVRSLVPLPVNAGDRVKVRGFLLPGEYSPVLEDAVVERVSTGDLPNPERISIKSALEGVHDSEYVALRGKLSEVRSSRDGVVLVLEDHETFFDARGPADGGLASLRVGSIVEVRGICRAELERSDIPLFVRGFSLMFDSPASVSILKAGPWWDLRKISWALLLIGACATAAALWAFLLRRQVAAKTRELRNSLEAKRKSRLFDVARNEVLESIARNACLPESLERLALAVEEQIAGSVCLVAMPSDGKSFLNGKPSPLLIAPSLPEEVHSMLLPVLSGVLHAELAKTDQDLVATLLGPLSTSEYFFASGRVTVVVGGSGQLVGLLILLLKGGAAPGDATQKSILQSASRLISLAEDHYHMHERLVHEARHDGLTGLPNRTVAEDRLEQALARAKRRPHSFAVFCIDLDGFKAINDELGHDTGDALLCAVSSRLRGRIRHSDTLARMGGDEFLAVIDDCSCDGAAQTVGQSLITALQEPFVLDGRELRISSSIGIAMYPEDGKNASQLRRNADLAMYEAKSQGGSRTAFSRQEVLVGKGASTSSSS